MQLHVKPGYIFVHFLNKLSPNKQNLIFLSPSHNYARNGARLINFARPSGFFFINIDSVITLILELNLY